MNGGNDPYYPENLSVTVEGSFGFNQSEKRRNSRRTSCKGSNTSCIKSRSARVGQILAGSNVNRTTNVGDMSQGGHGVSLRVVDCQ
eukprot:11826145-Ditylum_brightwellii.AAC.1